jgi:hypothetical protein
VGPVALREQTAGRLMRRLGEIPSGAGFRSPGRGGDATVLVRCTGDEPAAGSGVGAECYPGVVVRNAASLEVADQVDAGAVWLTVLSGTAAAQPAAGGLYWCQLAGPVELDGVTRPRAFGTGPDILEFETTYANNGGSGPGVTAGVWGNLTASLQLPGAGTYLVWGTVSGAVNSSGGRVFARLFNDTTGQPVVDTEIIVIDSASSGTGATAGRAQMMGVITVTGNDFIYCQAKWGGSGVIGVGPDFIAYAKLAGAAPGAGGGYTGTVGEG